MPWGIEGSPGPIHCHHLCREVRSTSGTPISKIKLTRLFCPFYSPKQKLFPQFFSLSWFFLSISWFTRDDSWWDSVCHQTLLGILAKCPQVRTEQCDYTSLYAVSFTVRHSVPHRIWVTDPKFSFHCLNFLEILICHSVTLILNGLTFQNAFMFGSNCHGTLVFTIKAWPVTRWITIELLINYYLVQSQYCLL